MSEKPDAASDSPSDTAPDIADEAKDKFRAALERKRGHKHPHESATSGDSKVHNEHGAQGGKRNFRRKSGG